MSNIDVFSEGIKQICEVRGEEVFANARLFHALLDDIVPALTNERKIFRSVIDDSLLKELSFIFNEDKSNKHFEAIRIKKKIEDNNGLSKKWSSFIVESFMNASGHYIDFSIIKEESEEENNLSLNITEKENISDLVVIEDGYRTYVSNFIEEVKGEIICDTNGLQNKETYEAYKKIRSVLLLQNTIVSCSPYHVVGVCSDGTVWAEGGMCEGFGKGKDIDVAGWKNIVAVSAGDGFSVGVKADGSVITTEGSGFTRYNSNTKKNQYIDLSHWCDVLAVSSYAHVVGLKTDGTVVAEGINNDGECNVADWRDIISIATSPGRTVGLKKDGTVVLTGRKIKGENTVKTWEHIDAIALFDDILFGLKCVNEYKVEILISSDVKLKSDRIINDEFLTNYSRSRNGFLTCSVLLLDYALYTVTTYGTFFVVGTDFYGISDFEQIGIWNNIIAICQRKSLLHSDAPLVCIKSDGTVEAFINYKKKSINKRLFKSFDTWEKEFENYRSLAKQNIIKENAEREKYKSLNLCQHCGGALKGLFVKKCVSCGKEKDY